MNQSDSLLDCCLFFTATSLARAITRLGEEEFSRVGMTPSYAFLLVLVLDNPGIQQKALAAHLHMAPSTVSRFVDSLVARGLLEKRIEGRNTRIFPTGDAKKLKKPIAGAWQSLYERYSEILGKQAGDELTALTGSASKKLQAGETADPVGNARVRRV
jgi:DNA-binding MarR family transcriptional regulator